MGWRVTNRGHNRTRTEALEAVLFGAGSKVNKNEHLEACKSCASEAKELSTLIELLDEWDAPEPSPYFDTRLRARLRAEADAPSPFWKVVRSVRPRWPIALASVLAGFLIVYGFFSAVPRPVSTEPTSEISAVVDLQALDRDADLLSDMNWLENGDPESD